MGIWSNLTSKHIEKEIEALKNKQTKLRAKTEEYWNELIETLRRDIEKLSPFHSHNIGEIKIEVEDVCLISCNGHELI